MTATQLKAAVKGVAAIKGMKLTAEQTDAFVVDVQRREQTWILNQAIRFTTPSKN
jgi:hypothetical protein